MRAAQIDRFGGPDAIVISHVDPPTPAAGEVLVRVEATSVNGHDTAVRSGALKIMTGRRFPIGIGLDFAGTITGLGPDVTGHVVGDRVWGTVSPRARHTSAAAADYVVIAASRVARRPEGLSATDAASLVVTATTAWTALHDKARLTAGEQVLVRGAAGGVGAAAVQLAHALGGRVTALARARDLAFVTGLGAEHALDYRTTTPEQLDRYDVILDTTGSQLLRYRRRLRGGGRMVTVAFGSGAAMAAIAASTVHGARRVRTFSADPDTATLDAVRQHVEAGHLHATVDHVYRLDDITAAHQAYDTGGHPGKQVLDLAPPAGEPS